MKRSRSSDNRFGTARLLPTLLILASVASAVVTHVGIDVLGDVLLPRDAYDYVAHGSRNLGLLVGAMSLLATFAIALRAAFRDARGDAGALTALLERAVLRSPLLNWVIVTMAALAITAAMEAIDSVMAGRPCDDIGDLLGGSLPLAFCVAAFVSLAISLLVRTAIAKICAAQRDIVSFVELFTRLRTTWHSIAFVSRGDERRSITLLLALGHDADGRAPPVSLLVRS